MAIRASISKGYIWRPGVIGLAALGASGWFLYDGTVKYPRQEMMWQAYSDITQAHINDPIEASRVWEQKAIDQGWPTKKPIERASKDKFTQKLYSGITAPIGLLFCISFFRTRGRWIEADEQGLSTRSGRRAVYGDIKSLDKTRWQSKGIAVVHYQTDGQAGRITLDDWKYDREPTKRIMEIIEQNMPGGDEDDAADTVSPQSSDA